MGSHGSPGGMRYNTVPHGSNKSRIGRIFKADDIPLVEHSCGGRTALAASPNQTWPGDTVMPVIRPDLRILTYLFQTDQESRGEIRERGCCAIDRSLTRALVSPTLVLI